MAYIETSNDLNIKYESTYAGLIKEDGSKSLLMLGEFFNSNGTISLHYQELLNDGNHNFLEVEWNSIKDKVTTTYPEMGAVNYEDSVLFLKRKLKLPSPSKYRKGLRADSFIGFDPTTLEKEALARLKAPFSSKKKLLTTIGPELFFKNHIDYEDAVESLTNGNKLGCSLNSTYYLTVSFHLNCILLWRNAYTIGKISVDSEHKIDLLTPLFNKELSLIGIPV